MLLCTHWRRRVGFNRFLCGFYFHSLFYVVDENKNGCKGKLVYEVKALFGGSLLEEGM